MRDAGPLVDDVAGLHQGRLVLIHEACPAFCHDDDLEFAFVLVPAGAFLWRQVGVGLDQMADHLPTGGIRNAEIAIQEEVAQTPAPEFGIAGFDVREFADDSLLVH
jgi:hypothetical protein